jgi:hypothetical protein
VSSARAKLTLPRDVYQATFQYVGKLINLDSVLLQLIFYIDYVIFFITKTRHISSFFGLPMVRDLG